MNDPDIITNVVKKEVVLEQVLFHLVMDMADRGMTYRDMSGMLKRLVFKVFMRKHGNQIDACKALSVSRGAFCKWVGL